MEENDPRTQQEGNILLESVLEPNSLLAWNDEAVWYYVSPPEFLSDEAERTVIVLGWPGSNSLEASVYKSGNSKSPIDAQPVGHS